MLEYEDFEALGYYLHKLAHSTYSKMVQFIDHVKKLH
jgi:hypothetical protein